MARAGGPPGSRGAPWPRGACSVCGREVSTTEGGVNAVWHNRPGRAFPSCEGKGRPVVPVPPNAANGGVTVAAPNQPRRPRMSALTPRHWALAAEAVTSGPPNERDIVERVATAIAEAEDLVRFGSAYCPDCGVSADEPAHRDHCPHAAVRDLITAGP